MSAASSLRCEAIGGGYARTRREDPRVAALIDRALGGARSVVNVGAGTGSYEPPGRHVIAVEPSDVMASQRPSGLAPAIAATAGQLPLRDDSVDAAMAVLTVHHWDAEQKRGIRELSRVARDTVVIVTYDPEVHGSMWLMADYLPEVADLDMRICPRPEQIVAWLGGGAEVQTIETTRDTPDCARIVLGSSRASARRPGAPSNLGVRTHGPGRREPRRERHLGRPPQRGLGPPARTPARDRRGGCRPAPHRRPSRVTSHLRLS